MDKAFRVSRLLWRYKKSGGKESGLVRPFDSWPTAIRRALEVDGGLSPEEMPFLAFYEGPSKWSIVTLERLVWKQQGQVQQLPIAAIKEEGLSDAVMAALRKEFEEEQENSKAHAKLNARHLQLTTHGGSKVLVEFERGSVIGLWNMIRFLMVQSRPNDQQPGN